VSKVDDRSSQQSRAHGAAHALYVCFMGDATFRRCISLVVATLTFGLLLMCLPPSPIDPATGADPVGVVRHCPISPSRCGSVDVCNSLWRGQIAATFVAEPELLHRVSVVGVPP